MKDSYGYEIKNITKLSEITVGDYHYIYKGVHFLYKNHNQKYLLVPFHGAVRMNFKAFPIFRYYNLSYNDIDILCISDALLDKYRDKNVLLTWFSSTKKYNFQVIYDEIIGFFVKNYLKVLFTGSSGGGFPALYFACKFNKFCLIGNSQIYIHKYLYFSTLNRILQQSNDQLITINIEDFFRQKPPLKIILSYNIYDTIHYENHALPFAKFCQNINFINLITLFFHGKNSTSTIAHGHYFNKPIHKLIRKFFFLL